MKRRQRRLRKSCQPRLIESLENRNLLTGFTAFNGLFSSGDTNENTTFYSDVGGRDSAGPLIDVETGEATQVLLTTSQVGVHFGGNGSQPASGTDAHSIFDGFVDFAAGGERSIEVSSGDAYQYSFENLDAGATYEFAGTAIRGNSGYTDRWTLIELQGAVSATADHSTGPGVVRSGLPANQIAIWTGNNASSGEGYVAQWLDIDPGADGTFHVTSTQYTGPVPTQINSSGEADGSKGYGISGIRLVENVPAGPPAVENLIASEVMAFEATVGGRVTTTGGQVPEITVYYGETDGGTNSQQWQNSLDLGKASREFSAILDGLDQATTYYYRSFAENSLGNDWADSSQSFTTLSAGPPELQILPAENVGAFAAELTGRITNTGNDAPIVTVYYGDNDGGTNKGSWDESIELGVQSGTFTAAASDLDPTSQYFFSARAQNSLGSQWTDSLSFKTTETPPLQISEFVADNATTLTTRVRTTPTASFRGDRLTPDWIELHNPTATVADVGGFHITDDLGQPRQWEIPAGTLIPARGYLVVFASGLDIRDSRFDERGNLHTNFQLASNSGAELALTDAEGEVVFSLTNLPVQSEDIAYGVDQIGTERFYASPTPGDNNANDVPKAPQISHSSQTFTGSIVVELTPALPTHSVRYTLNERSPTTSSTLYSGPITIDSTTQLRAISVAPNGKSSTVVGESYIELARSVTDDTSNLPIVIVDTFGDGVPGRGSNFGDAFVGIIEPGENGEASLTSEFDVETRAGIHVRGSSSAGFSKKQYRVELWDQRDEDQKYQVLGMPKEADWIFYGPGQYDRSLVANPLMYDLSNQIGQYATRTRWVEMYLNSNGGTVSSSDYVGLYAIMEVIEQGDDRVDVELLSTGAGGVPVNGGFVWKNDRGSAYVDPDDTTSAQRRHIDGWINDLKRAASGANAGDPLRGYEKYADVGSFIDHNILNLFAMNVDAMRLSSFYHKTAEGKLVAGPIWDFDRSLDSTDGRDNNPRTWYGSGDSTRYFNDSDRVMSWWPDMFDDADFVQRYIDRWTELRQNELSLESVYATIDAHAAEISDAAARDYRRWSGSRYSTFAGEIRHLKDWIEDRVNWIDSKWMDPPQYSEANAQLPVGAKVSLTSSQGIVYYTLDGSDPRGENGAIRPEAIRASAPVSIDGFTQITARVYKSGHGSSRNGYEATGDDWSAPATAVYFNDSPAAAGNLVISEINYNPAAPTAAEELLGFDNNDDFEFIELLNVSDQPLVLTGTRLAVADYDGEEEGVAFDFSNGSIHTLAPGERLIVVEDADAFAARYGKGAPVAGEWNGSLSNNREQLTLLAYDGATIQQFAYNDSGLWPGRADGNGSSLEIVNRDGNLDDPRNWRASVLFNGSPGGEDAAPLGVVVNEILAHTDPPETPPDSIELLNPTSAAIDLGGWYLSDSSENMLKYRIANGTVLGPGEYLVFDESDFNPTPLNPGPNDFALSSARGDDVWLVMAENGQPSKFADDVHFGATPNGESIGRLPNGRGVFAPMLQRTLGAANSAPRVGPVIISELNYNPGSVSIQALVLDRSMTPDDLEFVEVFNSTGFPIDLTDWRVRGGVDYDFDAGLQLAAGEALLVIPFDPDKPENVNRTAAFRAHYQLEASVKLVGGYDGQLNDQGESVRLDRPDSPPAEDPDYIPRMLEDQVTYDVVAPWPNANGTRTSLTRVTTTSFGSFPNSWVAATPSPGQTGFDVDPVSGDVNGDGNTNSEDIDLVCVGVRTADLAYDLNQDGSTDLADVRFLVESVLQTTAGDANADGVFNSSDLVQIFAKGEYEDGIVDNSVWSEGDWNCDGEFDSSDLIVAFQAGSYQAGAGVAATRGWQDERSQVPDLTIQSGNDNRLSSPVTRLAENSPWQDAGQSPRGLLQADQVEARDAVFGSDQSFLNSSSGQAVEDLDLDLLSLDKIRSV